MSAPTGIPVSAVASCPGENAAVITGADHPVSAVIDTDNTGNA
jgi:hypothetical protein